MSVDPSRSVLVLASALGVRTGLLTSTDALWEAARTRLVAECLSRQTFVRLGFSEVVDTVSEGALPNSWWESVEPLLHLAGLVVDEVATLHASGTLDPYVGRYLLPERAARSEADLLVSLGESVLAHLEEPTPSTERTVRALVETLWGTLLGRPRPAVVLDLP